MAEKTEKHNTSLITQKDLEQFQNIYLKMTATQDNCVFVNFHKTNKLPVYCISDFFNKMVLFMERTEAYKRFQRNNFINEEEFEKKIKEEARIRKIRAKALISRHKIGSAIAGFLPGADYFANKYFIKKDAARKVGQIFGFDLQELEQSIKRQEIKKENLNNNKLHTNFEESQYEKPKLKLIENKDNKDNNNNKDNKNGQKDDKEKKKRRK